MDKAFEETAKKMALGYCGAMNDEQMSMFKRFCRQITLIVDYAQGGDNKLCTMMFDTQKGIIFPVFSQDTVETIINRYLKLYPNEAKIMINSFKDLIDGNEGGWSKARLMKLDAQMPVKIKNAGMAISRDFWLRDNGENYKKFKSICPKLTTRARKV